MPSSQLMTVHDVSALSDALLGEFMKKHRRADDSFELPIDGWDRLSKEERDRLAQRLQLIKRAFTDSPTPNSRPLDLDKLDTLLRDVANGEDSLSLDQPPARERETQSPEDSRDLYKQKEMVAYNNLVKDGGRPLYRFDLLESVSKDPDVYHEMLEPFWRRPRSRKPSEMDQFDNQDVMQRQWHRWQNFRKWQLNNRGIDNEDEDDGFLAYVEEIKRGFIEVGWTDSAAEIEADPTILKKPGEHWCYIQRHRNWQRLYQRESGCKSFSDYKDAVKARLTRHAFSRRFHLAEDPKQQDELTTWIEYLNFEYWWLDRYTASIERLKPKHDEAWEELKKKGVLEDDETPDFVRTDASAIRCQGDKDHAWKVVQDAESEAEKVYQMTQKDPNRLSIPKEQRVQMLVKARKRLSAARAAHDLTKRRSHLITGFVRGTFDYDDAKEDVANQTNLVEWVLSEAYAIEAEQKSAILESMSEKKRKASAEVVCLGQSDPKRKKPNARDHSSQPRNDKASKGDRRALRRRTRPSEDTNRQLDQDEGHSVQHTHSSHTNPAGRVVDQVPLIETEPESNVLEGRSRKRRRFAVEDASLIVPTPKRLKSNAQGHGSQPGNNRAGVTGRRALRIRNRPTTGVSQELDQHQTQKVHDTNSSSPSPVPKAPSQESTQGLRCSSRLAALRPGPDINSARYETRSSSELGSEYIPVENILEKRVRKRGRGCITEYLVKFKGYDSSRNLWTSAMELPKNATEGLDQFES